LLPRSTGDLHDDFAALGDEAERPAVIELDSDGSVESEAAEDLDTVDDAVGAEAPAAKRARGAHYAPVGRYSTAWDPSTVWCANSSIPIIKNKRDGLVEYYVVCPCHQSRVGNGQIRKCRRSERVTVLCATLTLLTDCAVMFVLWLFFCKSTKTCFVGTSGNTKVSMSDEDTVIRRLKTWIYKGPFSLSDIAKSLVPSPIQVINPQSPPLMPP
jgi:hypothetical protein